MRCFCRCPVYRIYRLLHAFCKLSYLINMRLLRGLFLFHSPKMQTLFFAFCGKCEFCGILIFLFLLQFYRAVKNPMRFYTLCGVFWVHHALYFAPGLHPVLSKMIYVLNLLLFLGSVSKTIILNLEFPGFVAVCSKIKKRVPGKLSLVCTKNAP